MSGGAGNDNIKLPGEGSKKGLFGGLLDNVKHGMPLMGDARTVGEQMVKEGLCKADELIVLKGGMGSNSINVTAAENGGIAVDLDGKKYSFTADEAKRLIIDGGAGNDKIRVAQDVKNNLHIVGGMGNDDIEGGSGNDVIYDKSGSNVLAGGGGSDRITSGNGKDTIYGGMNQYDLSTETRTGAVPDGDDVIDAGGGRDYVEAGAGNDTVKGGTGDDVIYGGQGNDNIEGGEGADYIDGGKGSDKLKGGAGNDMIFGGRGNDNIQGGAGSDVIAGGKGNDTISGGKGDDKITVGTSEANGDTLKGKEAGDTVSEVEPMDVPDNIKIGTDHAADKLYTYYSEFHKSELAASDNFQDRVEDDLDTMASLQIGQDYFNDMAATGKTVTIRQLSADNGGAPPQDSRAALKEDGTHGEGCDSDVYYNPSKIGVYNDGSEGDDTPAIAFMAHEMSHAYNSAHGSLDYNHMVVEHSGLSSGPEVTGAEMQAVGRDVEGIEANPYFATENGWRRELGVSERKSYTGVGDGDVEVK